MYKISDINDAEMAFGARDILKIMPDYKSIPDEFKNFNSKNKWIRLCSDMFFLGVKNIKMTPRTGVDSDKAFRHVRSIMVSYAPKHEHKAAACAYLFDQWFSDATWEVKERKIPTS